MISRLLTRLSVSVLLAVGGALLASPASAHRLNVFAYVVGGQVQVEAYFSGGARAQGADVTVYSAEKEVLLTGRTDKDGLWAFPVPAVEGDLEIVAETEDGHKGRCALKAEELAGSAPRDDVPTAGAEGPDAAGEARSEPAAPLGASGDLDEIRASLERIDASLRTVQRQLAELRRPRAGPSLDRVLAGVGFIVGLTGVAMYFMARNAARK